MKVTTEKYNKLKNMGLVNVAKYDLNDRVAIIIQEVNDYLAECERRAREMLETDFTEQTKTCKI